MYYRSVTNWTRSTKFKSKRVQIKIRVYAFERLLRFYLVTRFTVTVHTQKRKLITASTMYISVFCVFCYKTCLSRRFFSLDPMRPFLSSSRYIFFLFSLSLFCSVTEGFLFVLGNRVWGVVFLYCRQLILWFKMPSFFLFNV